MKQRRYQLLQDRIRTMHGKRTIELVENHVFSIYVTLHDTNRTRQSFSSLLASRLRGDVAAS